MCVAEEWEEKGPGTAFGSAIAKLANKHLHGWQPLGISSAKSVAFASPVQSLYMHAADVLGVLHFRWLLVMTVSCDLFFEDEILQ
jgi:hypothetical protein